MREYRLALFRGGAATAAALPRRLGRRLRGAGRGALEGALGRGGALAAAAARRPAAPRVRGAHAAGGGAARHAHVAVEALKLKTQRSQWVQIAGATLAGFALSTLLASALGAALAIALQSIVPSSEPLAQAWGLASGASVAFECPSDVANGSIALQSDGNLVCSENATTFVIDDVARTFVLSSMTKASSVAEQVVMVAESVFPESLAGAFVDGDVLSLVVGGIAVGVALVCFAVTDPGHHDAEGRQDQHVQEDAEEKHFVLLWLVAQAESIFCRAISWLQIYSPIGIAFMIGSVLLHASPSASDNTYDDTLVAAALALMAVLLLALVLDVVLMLLLAIVFTRSNPFAFLEHLLPAQVLALSSGSSLVALPATVSSIVASKRVSPQLAFIVSAVSTVLNQTGTALYLSVATLFVLSASASGMNEDERAASQSASTITAMVIANVVIAGVVSPLPRGSKAVALATTLGAVFGISAGPRAALLAFLAGLEWITGPFVACVNVTNGALMALVVAHYFEDPPLASAPAAGTAADPDGSGAPTQESPTLDLRRQRPKREERPTTAAFRAAAAGIPAESIETATTSSVDDVGSLPFDSTSRRDRDPLTMTMSPSATAQFRDPMSTFHNHKGVPWPGATAQMRPTPDEQDDMLVDLYYKTPSLWMTTVAGAIGFVVGAVLNKYPVSGDAQLWIGVIGALLIRALECLTLPLIFTSVTICFSNLVVSDKTRPVMVRLSIYFVLAALAASCVAVAVAFCFSGSFTVMNNPPAASTNFQFILRCPNGKYFSRQDECAAQSLRDGQVLTAVNVTGLRDDLQSSLASASGVFPDTQSLATQIVLFFGDFFTENITSAFVSVQFLGITIFSMIVGAAIMAVQVPGSFVYVSAMEWVMYRLRRTYNIIMAAFIARIIAEQLDETVEDEEDRAYLDQQLGMTRGVQ
ncbi:unnamed protein product [Phytophthora lilii]|uniref:Unnamed protein product n=1 Tax=Phytophthora lilii TaxID=2077276 RepID=A0A9W6WW61_9STRA|nr:unnamed protein product [Phytophthora lilii]